MSVRPVLVTGGAGFIGCNLADRLARDGRDVLVLDALARPGVERNLAWLRARHPDRISFVQADIRDADAVGRAVGSCSAVFHFAAQVAVTRSLVDPALDFGVNLQGTMLVLEAARPRRVPVIFASTNKVYGDLGDLLLACDSEGGGWQPADDAARAAGVGEARPLDFHTPYGCSKGAADQYVLDYARSFGIPAAVVRMSCIYGPRQMGTEDQGWVAHFLLRALAGEEIQIFGDGHQVRDILFVDDAVDAYVRLLDRIDANTATPFNLGGGPANAVSLHRLIRHIETLVDHRVPLRHHGWRPGDQKYYVSDNARITAALGLAPPVAWQEGVGRLAAWMQGTEAAHARRPAGARDASSREVVA